MTCGVLTCRGAAEPIDTLVYTGMCDASAAVAVDADVFVVANDEDNVLRFYRLSQAGPAIQTLDLAPVLGLKRKAEMDLEGAARLGGKVFWIASHGRNKDGELAPNRHQLFALEISGAPPNFRLQRAGVVVTNLVSAMARDARLVRFGLDHAARKAPKERGGLSIEALTDTPDGTLLIGFRNPVPEGRALVVPLLNPIELITGAPPKFGEPLLLELGGLGLRGMGSTGDGYYLIAGPVDGEGESRLCLWKGPGASPEPVPQVGLRGLNPEAICFHDSAESKHFWVLSDDGSRKLDGKDCKDLPAPQRRFRAYQISR